MVRKDIMVSSHEDLEIGCSFFAKCNGWVRGYWANPLDLKATLVKLYQKYQIL